ncbi:MAG: methylenetetrahydrofolate reductase C-terminal domain-containing protein [Proteobacteria bacterium]|nr:methylenetetrahydrofolate reductase C-terminal domain-containing protein [Pseudomonadota bacterium]
MANESDDGASRAEKSHAEVRVEVTPGSRETEVISKKPLSQQPFRSASNAIREGLHNGRFFWTIEFIPSRDKILHDELHKLGGIAGVISEDPLLAGFAVTDRVVSDRDPDPAAAASHLLDVSGKQPLVHFSGKGREVQHLHEFLSRLHENGLKNVLMLTGDRLKEEPKDRRPRYLESVPAIQLAKQFDPDLFVAAALNPFKYREEDAMAQYLKLGKKAGAGADCIITQIGFDMPKYEEALHWMETRGYRLPLMANVLPLSVQRARYIRAHQIPGVTVTDSFLALLEEEERMLADQGAARVLRRLALQILGVRYFGYAGVQITGLHSVEKVAALQALVQELSELCPDRLTWKKAWDESLTFAEGGRANPAPAHDPWYLMSPHPSRASLHERVKYKAMSGVHSFLFDKGLGARLLGPLMRPVKRHSTADRVFERIEHAIKSPLFGCETCGMCRLAATQYICPETCPKGLANGACGGTTDNLCEFGDRECVHSVKYRIAKDAGVLHELETWQVPAVPQDTRHTCSWPPHFRGEGPEIRVIDFLHPERNRLRNG